MTMLDKARADYLAGGITLDELAAKHGVSSSVVEKWSSQEHWVQMRRERQEKTAKLAVEKQSIKQAENSARVLDVAGKLLNKIELAVDMIDPAALAAMEKRELKALSGAIRDIREIMGIKSASDQAEQDARIAKLRAEAEEQKRQGGEIRLTLSEELDQYAE